VADRASYLAAALLIGFACYRALLDRRGAHDPALRHICCFALSVGASLVVLAPSSLAALERLPGLGPGRGLAGLGVLLGLELKTAGLTGLALFARTLDGRARRRSGVLAVAVMALAAVLFAAARPRCTAGAAEAAGAGRWLLAGYDLLFVVYGMRCLGLFVTLMGRHARRIAASGLKAGLKLMAAAGGVGMLWTLWLLSDLPALLRTGRQATAEDTPSAAMAVACAVLAVAGATAAMWGRALSAPWRMVRARRAYRALHPLWSALNRAHPGIALPPPRGHCRPGPARAEFALYRRVIEIHDGCLSLRPYCPPQGVPLARPEAAAGREAAAREAAALVAGLAARSAGLPPRPAPPAEQAYRPEQPCGESIEADVAWLLLVAEAFEAAMSAAGGRDGPAGTVRGRDTAADPSTASA
jgi:hypothetical protein